MLANKIYGTKQHLPKGHWQEPMLQQMLDQEFMLDIAHKSEVIDINKGHHRRQIFDSISRLANAELQDPKEKDVKYQVRKSTLRKMYQIQCHSQMSRKEQYASDLKSDLFSKLGKEQLQKRI